MGKRLLHSLDMLGKHSLQPPAAVFLKISHWQTYKLVGNSLSDIAQGMVCGMMGYPGRYIDKHTVKYFAYSRQSCICNQRMYICTCIKKLSRNNSRKCVGSKP